MEKTLGTRIGDLRRERGLKQDEIAEKLGVSAQAVSKWENDVSCPDIMMLPKLAKILEVSVDELLSEDGERLLETTYLPPEKRKSINEMMLRIRMDCDGDVKIRVNLPIAIIKAILESGGSFDGISFGPMTGKIDFEKIIMMVDSGMVGKLVELDAEDVHIEIVVE